MDLRCVMVAQAPRAPRTGSAPVLQSHRRAVTLAPRSVRSQRKVPGPGQVRVVSDVASGEMDAGSTRSCASLSSRLSWQSTVRQALLRWRAMPQGVLSPCSVFQADVQLALEWLGLSPASRASLRWKGGAQRLAGCLILSCCPVMVLIVEPSGDVYTSSARNGHQPLYACSLLCWLCTSASFIRA